MINKLHSHWRRWVSLMTLMLATLLYTLPSAAEPVCTPLLSGKTIAVGEVCVANTAENLIVKYKLSDVDEFDELMFDKLHLFVGKELVTTIPQNKLGQPKIGQFPYVADLTSEREHEFVLPLADLGVIEGDTLVIAAHADIYKYVLAEDGITLLVQTETGWASGIPMVQKGSWAMYFTYEVQPFEVVEP